jgi:hypothetical protein
MAFGLSDSDVERVHAHLVSLLGSESGTSIQPVDATMATQNERVERQQAEGAANILMYMNHDGHQEMSLLKPEIGRRVALMHGTTKRRWERQARAF